MNSNKKVPTSQVIQRDINYQQEQFKDVYLF